MSKELKDYLLEKKHHIFRKDFPEYENLGETYHALGLSPKERMTRRFELFAGLEDVMNNQWCMASEQCRTLQREKPPTMDGLMDFLQD